MICPTNETNICRKIIFVIGLPLPFNSKYIKKNFNINFVFENKAKKNIYFKHATSKHQKKNYYVKTIMMIETFNLNFVGRIKTFSLRDLQ